MAIVQGRSTFKKVLYAPATILVLFVLCALLGTSVYDLYQKKKGTDVALKDALLEESLVLGRKAQAEEKNARLETPEGKETIVREKQSVSRPGEQVIVVQDAATTTNSESEPGIFKKFFNWIGSFFGK